MGIFKRFLEELDRLNVLKFFRGEKGKKVPRKIKKQSIRARKLKTKLEKNYEKIYGKNLPREINDLASYSTKLTVGELRQFLSAHPEISDDATVLIERVEDFYYEKNGWSVVYKESDNYRFAKKLSEDTNESLTETELQYSKNQYTPAFCCVKYAEDDNLYVNLHY